MGKPIAVINSNHVCPAFDGPKPHIGGQVLQGSSNVFSADVGVSRVGDQAQCNSPSPDIITSGSGSVFINGMPCARMQDQTAHGGTIASGNNSVLIG